MEKAIFTLPYILLKKNKNFIRENKFFLKNKKSEKSIATLFPSKV
jgi:hypothetical protein